MALKDDDMRLIEFIKDNFPFADKIFKQYYAEKKKKQEEVEVEVEPYTVDNSITQHYVRTYPWHLGSTSEVRYTTYTNNELLFSLVGMVKMPGSISPFLSYETLDIDEPEANTPVTETETCNTILKIESFSEPIPIPTCKCEECKCTNSEVESSPTTTDTESVQS